MPRHSDAISWAGEGPRSALHGNRWSVQLDFEWPLCGRSASAEKSKADFRLMQSKAEMRLAAERIAQEVAVVLDEVLIAEEELTATREAMDAAQRVMKGEEVMFELGQKDNQDLLDVQDISARLTKRASGEDAMTARRENHPAPSPWSWQD